MTTALKKDFKDLLKILDRARGINYDININLPGAGDTFTNIDNMLAKIENIIAMEYAIREE